MTKEVSAKHLLAAAASLGCMALAMPAIAQQETAAQQTQDRAPGDIVVTAQRREERVQDVPIALSVMTGEDLLQRTATNVSDVLTTAPNVTRTGGGSGRGDANFFVRGIGQVDNSVAVDPGVGIYVDEVYLGRLQGASFDLFDIERVEVLRGPQGTLWGKNTIGGAVSIITRDPKLGEVSGRIRATVGERDHYGLFGTVNLPAGDDVAFSVSGLLRRQDGWAKNVFTGFDFGRTRVEGVRVKMLAQPSDSLTFRVAGDYVRDHGGPLNNILLAYNPNLIGMTLMGPQPGLSPTGVLLLPDQGADRGSRSVSYASIPPLDDIENYGVNGTIEWRGDNVTIKSITAYREVRRDVWNEFDGTGYRLYDSFNKLRQNQFSQELHLSGDTFDDKLRYVLGAYYFDEHAFNLVNICTGTNGPRLTGGCFDARNPIDLKVESIAGFANLAYSITDQISITGGIRYTWEKKIQSFASALVNEGVTGPGLPIIFVPPGGVFPLLPQSTVQDSFESWTPKISLDYKPSQDLLLYLSYGQGFKSGGFSGRPSNAMIVAYDPEVVDTFEGGFKWTIQRGLFLNGAAFHSKYKDIQLLISLPFGLFDTANAGDAEINGAELEMFGQISPNFGIQASVGYVDAGYTKLAPNVSGLTINNSLPVVSKWTISAGAQYRIPVSETSDVTLRADYNYRSRFSFQLENDPGEIQDGYGIVNLRGQYNFGDGKYSVALFGLNVFDKKYFLNKVDSLNSLGVTIGIPAEPSEWGLEFGLKF